MIYSVRIDCRVEEYYPHLLETNISELEATANNYTIGK